MQPLASSLQPPASIRSVGRIVTIILLVLLSFELNTGFLFAKKSDDTTKGYSNIAQCNNTNNQSLADISTAGEKNLTTSNTESSTSSNTETNNEPSLEDLFFKTTFFKVTSIINDIEVTKILGHAPRDGSSRDFDDKRIREDAVACATKEQIWSAAKTVDSIFDYSQVLGDKFNAHELPKTDALFQKIDADAHVAIHVAKYIFKRPRPLKSSGYSFPSGHSTRAFLWESLLSDIFPESQPKLYKQAQGKAWDRVILGRHYPADVSAGQTYGGYLAKEFFKNPEFQKEWNEVRKEIKKKFAKRA